MFVHQLCMKVQIRRTKYGLGVRIYKVWKSNICKSSTACVSHLCFRCCV